MRSRARWYRLAGTLFLDGFRAAPGWMTVVTAMLVLGSIASTSYPLGYKLLVDGALAGRPGTIVSGIAVVAGLLSVGWALMAIGGTEAMALSDRIALYRTAQLMDLVSGVGGLEHLERPDYLAQVEQLNAGRRQLAAAPRVVVSNAGAVARIGALLVLMATVSPWLLLLPLAAAAPIAADRIAKGIVTRAGNAMAAPQRLSGKVFALTTDAQSAAEVRAYGLVGYLRAEHRRLRDELTRRSATEALQVLAVQGAGWVVYALGLMTAIAFVVLRATEGMISLGTLLMSVSLIRRSRAQLASTAQATGSMVSTLATADRLFWLEDFAAAEAARAGTQAPAEALGHGIALDGVTFRYPGTERAVLDGVDLFLAAGETVALVGENGSGKTTLVKLLLGMYRPDAGSIRVDGTDLAQLDPAAWRARVTAAFQDFSRFQLPAVEVVGVGDVERAGDEPAALRALARAGAAELPAQLPQGLGTRVGTTFTDGHGLSGGQWQKLALGRAMRRQEPLLVVLDEPTASLDAQAEHALFERYAAGAREAARATGAVTVLVTHRFATVQMADRIAYLEAGRVVESGSHQELLSLGGRYAELFELQAAGYR